MDLRTSPLAQRKIGRLKISRSESKANERIKRGLNQRRTRSEGGALVGDDDITGNTIKGEARKLLLFSSGNVTSVNSVRANNSEPLDYVLNQQAEQPKMDGAKCKWCRWVCKCEEDQLKRLKSRHGVIMYQPLDCITDETPPTDDYNKRPRSPRSPTSPSRHSPLIPLAATKGQKEACKEGLMATSVDLTTLHITVEDKVHSQADPDRLVGTNDDESKKKSSSSHRDCDAPTLVTPSQKKGNSLKKKRGRPCSKAPQSPFHSKMQKTDVDQTSLSTDSCSNSDKENAKQTVMDLTKVKKGKPLKRKKSSGSKNVKEEVERKEATKIGFKKKLRSSCADLVTLPSPDKHLRNLPSPERSLRKRVVVDWSVLRKKIHNKDPEEVDIDKTILGSNDLDSENLKKTSHESRKKRKSSPEKIVTHPKPKGTDFTEEEISSTSALLEKSCSTVNHFSPTFVDSDLARPSRNVVRPVRLGDQLEQAQQNLAIMRLPSSGSTPLPYQLDTLTWNKQHTVNEEGCYCYCGGEGEWHSRMVCCSRCSQWFHERCLAPRPLAMPLVPGDPFWLFVCVHCNSGSECLKRMDLTWTELVHLTLFDLTMKTERKFHHFEKDLIPFLRSSWDTYQLKKHFTSLSDEDRKIKLSEELANNSSFKNGVASPPFMNGCESDQDGHLWGLRCLTPPLRPLYKVPSLGIIQERTVLDEVVIEDVGNATEESVNIIVDNLNIEYNTYKPKTYKPAEVSRDKEPNSSSSSQEISSKTACPTSTTAKSRKNASKKTKNTSKKIEHAQVPEKLKEACEEKRSKSICQLSPSETSEPRCVTQPKLLPYEISKILHQKGYPKVAMKFASIIPPKRSDVPKCVQTKDIRKTNKRRKGGSTTFGKSLLDSLIPSLPSYTGRNNPFHLSSSTESLDCHCNLNQTRKGKRKSSGEENNILPEKVFANSGPCENQMAGRFVGPLGKVKLIMMLSQTSDLDLESSLTEECNSCEDNVNLKQEPFEKRTSDIKKSLDKMISRDENGFRNQVQSFDVQKSDGCKPNVSLKAGDPDDGSEVSSRELSSMRGAPKELV